MVVHTTAVIPQYIHHIWIDPSAQSAGISNIPVDAQENLLRWRETEFRYKPKIWTLKEIGEICRQRDLTDVDEAIRACRFPSMKADIGRLLLLQVFGGFWVDLKLHLNHRFLDHLHQYELILTEHFPKPDFLNPNGHICNSFIGSKPAHPIIIKTLEAVVKNVNSRKPGSIYHITGATNLNEAFGQTEDRGKYYLLPYQLAWNYLFTIKGGSYNGRDMHWSQREQVESPYVD